MIVELLTSLIIILFRGNNFGFYISMVSEKLNIFRRLGVQSELQLRMKTSANNLFSSMIDHNSFASCLHLFRKSCNIIQFGGGA